MPVILEKITAISQQDNLDLLKIYQNYRDPAIESHEHWVHSKLANGHQLYAGRFNGRIVGCLWIIDNTDHWQLEHLCVRDITLRRGVARQMLTLLINHANSQRCNLLINLLINNHPRCEIIRPLLIELDFILTTDSNQSGIWQKNLQP